MANKKSPFNWSPEEMASYVSSVRDTVQTFINQSGEDRKFSELLAFMERPEIPFRTADEKMFEEWTKKEFPGQFTYTHSIPGTYDGDEETDSDSD